MGQRKFTLYKDIKIGRGWQKAKVAFYSNGKIKPNIIIYKGKEQEHPEGAYYANDRRKWIFAGKDALKAQRFRADLLDRHEIARLKGEPLQPTPAPAVTKGTPLKEAMDTWLANLEAQGRDVKTIRTYRAAVAPFVAHCKVKTVEECRDNKQVMFDYMAWLRKQPKTKRRNANPQRTYSNKLGHVACFLRHFGVKTSAALRKVLDQVAIVAPTQSTVLLHGETGTGKELFARAIHNLSSHRERTFVRLNCAAIPSGLVESELFGHEKGAFTGALMQKRGRFELGGSRHSVSRRDWRYQSRTATQAFAGLAGT